MKHKMFLIPTLFFFLTVIGVAVAADAQDYELTFEWEQDDAIGQEVKEWRIYAAQVPNNPLGSSTVIAILPFDGIDRATYDVTVTFDETGDWYFRATAVDVYDFESLPSNEVHKFFDPVTPSGPSAPYNLTIRIRLK